MIRSIAAIGAFALDAEGRVLLVSPVVEEVSGQELHAIRNHHYLEYVPPQVAPIVRDHFRRALEGERVEGQLQIVTAGGDTVRVGCTAQPDRDSAGTVISITGTIWRD